MSEVDANNPPQHYAAEPPTVDVEQVAGRDPRQIFNPIPTGPAPPVAWDPDDHVYKVVVAAATQQAEPSHARAQLEPSNPELAQLALDELSKAGTVRALADAMLNFVEAAFGMEPRA